MVFLRRYSSLLEQPDNAASPEELRRVRASAGAEQVFDFHKWAKHRSRWKYWDHIASMPLSHTVRSICLPLLWIIAVTLCVGFCSELATHKLLPHWVLLHNSLPAGAALA